MKWIFLLGLSLSQFSNAQWRDKLAEQGIWNQLPERAERIPAQVRKVILVSDAPKFYHQSIPAATETLKMLGNKTGAFRIEKSTDDLTSLTDADFQNSDALFFLSTVGEIFQGREQLLRKILEYVKSGKGFVAFHAATDCCRSSPQFLQMLGAEFENHPWSSKTKVQIFADDPFHPLTAMLGGREISLREEIYQFKNPRIRDQVKVLLRLNNKTSPPSEKMKLRSDLDFPVSWIKPYGQGRVFYSALGHNAEVYSHPTIAKHFLAGIQYALGDLPADARPSNAHPFSFDLLPVEKSYFLLRAHLQSFPYPDGHLENLQKALVVSLDTKEPLTENWPLLSLLKLLPSTPAQPKNKWLANWLSSQSNFTIGPKKKDSKKILLGASKKKSGKDEESLLSVPDLNSVVSITDRTEFMKGFFLLSTEKKHQVAKTLLLKGTAFTDILRNFLINERPVGYLSTLQNFKLFDQDDFRKNLLTLGALPENQLSKLKIAFPAQNLSSGESPWIYSEVRNQWVRVSSFATTAQFLIDKNPRSRWSSSRLQNRGDFVRIDLGEERALKSIRLHSENSPGEHARHLKVVLGGSHLPEGGAVAFDGEGGPLLEVALKNLRVRTISFEITESFPALWSIGEIEIF